MTPADVISKLKDPGLLAVFLDDSGTPKRPLETLACDAKFVCAVALTSDDYAILHDTLADHLTRLSVPRFHATEIVNPKTDSAWKAVTIKQRVETLQFLYSTLGKSSCEFLWCPMNSEQFEGTMGDGIHLGQEIEDEHGKHPGDKTALWQAMRSAVTNHFADWADGRLAIVCEDEKGTDEIRLQPVGEGQLVFDGVLHAMKSARIHGLELADAAAYLLNRCHWIAAKSNHNPFDVAIAETWRTLGPRFRNVLDEPKK